MTRLDTTVHKYRYTCDRCGRVQEPPQGRWARISVQVEGVADETTFPVGVGPADICPNCVGVFKLWWRRDV
jgi:hypothetical protein